QVTPPAGLGGALPIHAGSAAQLVSIQSELSERSQEIRGLETTHGRLGVPYAHLRLVLTTRWHVRARRIAGSRLVIVGMMLLPTVGGALSGRRRWLSRSLAAASLLAATTAL